MWRMTAVADIFILLAELSTVISFVPQQVPGKNLVVYKLL